MFEISTDEWLPYSAPVDDSLETTPTGSTPYADFSNEMSHLAELDPTIYREIINMFGQDPKTLTGAVGQRFRDLLNFIINALEKGDYTALVGMGWSASIEKYIDDRVAQQNTQQNQSWEQEMRDTSVTSTASQLQSVGLSSSGVLSSGLASHSGVQTASNSMTNLGQQRAINRYNQQMGMAKQLISTVGQMASSGIYGGALGAVKNTANAVVSATAHSGLKALAATKKPGQQGFNSLISGDLAKKYAELPGSENM